MTYKRKSYASAKGSNFQPVSWRHVTLQHSTGPKRNHVGCNSYRSLAAKSEYRKPAPSGARIAFPMPRSKSTFCVRASFRGFEILSAALADAYCPRK